MVSHKLGEIPKLSGNRQQGWKRLELSVEGERRLWQCQSFRRHFHMKNLLTVSQRFMVNRLLDMYQFIRMKIV